MNKMSALVFKCLLFVSAVAQAACGLLVRHPSFDVFGCQVDALADYAPRAAAEDLVMAARAGQAEYVVLQLLRLGLDESSISAAAEAFHACAAAEPPPPPELPLPSVLDRS